jgi:hypothetical protein
MGHTKHDRCGIGDAGRLATQGVAPSGLRVVTGHDKVNRRFTEDAATWARLVASCRREAARAIG